MSGTEGEGEKCLVVRENQMFLSVAWIENMCFRKAALQMSETLQMFRVTFDLQRQRHQRGREEGQAEARGSLCIENMVLEAPVTNISYISHGSNDNVKCKRARDRGKHGSIRTSIGRNFPNSHLQKRSCSGTLFREFPALPRALAGRANHPALPRSSTERLRQGAEKPKILKMLLLGSLLAFS